LNGKSELFNADVRNGQPFNSYTYNGDMTVALTAFVDGNPDCYGFIVINNDRIVILDEFCNPMDFPDTTEVSVKNLITNDIAGKGTKNISINGFNVFLEPNCNRSES